MSLSIPGAKTFLRWSLLLLLALAALLFRNCTSGPAAKKGQIPVSFVGDQACQSCHEAEYREWKGSHHDLAMQEANAKTVLGDFEDATFTHQGVTSRFFRRGEEYWVETRGPRGDLEEYQVLYTFGVYPLQQYLVAFPRGRLQTLHLSWDSARDRWFMQQEDEIIPPGDWFDWTGASMNWNTMCAECHSTGLKKNYLAEADSFHTTWEVINVSCEACHGPGSMHVEKAGKPGYEYSKGELYLTSTTNQKILIDRCARCHARREVLHDGYEHDKSFDDQYRVSLINMPLYHADGQILDEDYVYGSFVQSKMYHQGVSCNDCHNSHSLELKAEGNQLCMQCHEPEYNQPQHLLHDLGSEGGQCISCHMPGRTYMGNDFRRDHSFRVPRPDLTVKFGTPNACTGCHQQEGPEWAANVISGQYEGLPEDHFSDLLVPGAIEASRKSPDQLLELARDTAFPAIARATALHYLAARPVSGLTTLIPRLVRDSSALVRRAALEASFVMGSDQSLALAALDDPVRTVRLAAMGLLISQEDSAIPEPYRESYQQVLSEYREYLAANADFREGQMRIAQYHRQRGEPQAAEKAYRRSLRLDSLFTPARVELASLISGSGRLEEARFLLESALKMEPEAGPTHYSLGLLLAEMGDMAGAESALAEAARLMPDNVRAYYNWGLTLQHQNLPRKAEAAYRLGLEASPDDPGLRSALYILYVQTGRPQEALGELKALQKLFPNDPQYRQAEQQLRANFGI